MSIRREMKFEVELLGKEIIKPSSPTPSHLRFYQLSFLDQLHGHNHMSFVMFYPSLKDYSESLNAAEISHKLKKSLSIVLTRYYPLAGRLKDDHFVDCNDEGIPYVEARVNCKLSDVVQNPILHDLHKFIPFELDGQVDVLLGIQLNIFDCGGVAIGSRFSHKIQDALSALMFIKCWAAATRGDDDDDQLKKNWPQFVSATLFPPKDAQVLNNPRVDFPMKNVVTKRFVFESSKLEVLREKYAKSKSLKDQTRRPSRVEALSAFIYGRYMAATQVGFGLNQKLYIVTHSFNLRTRIDLPLQGHSFGNLSRVFVQALDSTNCKEESYDDFVSQMMRDLMIGGRGKEHVKNLQEGIDQGSNFLKEHAEEFAKGNVVPLNFTSFCRFSLYEDFGWGMPSWVGKVPLPFKNFIVFGDTKSCDGIEAYFDLEEEDMARLQSDEEFLSFASPTD